MSMAFAAPTPAASPVVRRWYREPYVWMIIGGPLVVIVASIATLIIALKNPDPVLDRRPQAQAQTMPMTPKAVAPSDRTEAQLAVMPANQARNHVVTPTLPKQN